MRTGGLQLALEGVEQHQGGQGRRADRVALGNGLGRIANRVQAIGDRAYVLGELGHLGDAAGVVGDRSKGVQGDDEAGQRELSHDGHTDSIDAVAELPGPEDAQGDDDGGQRRGLIALGQALDDVCRVTRL
jgi:hypothetical protein